MKKSFKGAQKNILVVDDDLDIIDPIKLWLQKNGFAVSDFTDPINEKTGGENQSHSKNSLELIP